MAYPEFARRAVANALVEQGFRAAHGERRSQREFEDGTGFVEMFTDGRPTGPDEAQVSANSFRSHLLARAFDLEPPKILEPPIVQWKRRVGDLGESSPSWYWTVTTKDPRTIEPVVECLRTLAVPALLRHASDRALRDQLLDGPEEGLLAYRAMSKAHLAVLVATYGRPICSPRSRPGSGGSGTPAAPTARLRSGFSTNTGAELRPRPPGKLAARDRRTAIPIAAVLAFR
jgi:hypothetical protein